MIYSVYSYICIYYSGFLYESAEKSGRRELACELFKRSGQLEGGRGGGTDRQTRDRSRWTVRRGEEAQWNHVQLF